MTEQTKMTEQTIPEGPGCHECGYIRGYDAVPHSDECSKTMGFSRLIAQMKQGVA